MPPRLQILFSKITGHLQVFTKTTKPPPTLMPQPLAFSPWLVAGLALLPCPTLSYTYPEFWGTPGKKNQIYCGTHPPHHPQGLLLSPLSVSFSLCLLHILPHLPRLMAHTAPPCLLQLSPSLHRQPRSPHPPWLQPQAPNLSFQPEAPHFTKHGLPELRGTQTPTVQHPVLL